MNALHSAVDIVAKEIQEAERDKLLFETFDAQARSTCSTLDAIAEAKSMIDQCTGEEKERLSRSSWTYL